MNDKPDLTEPRLPFAATQNWPSGAWADQIATLLASVGDIALMIDAGGHIVDIAGAPSSLRGLQAQVGRRWIDTVTPDSRLKIEDMLDGQSAGRWRQVTQLGDGGDFPVRYLVLPLGADGQRIAIGRDERAGAVLQQRLLQVQQSLERDYLAMRQAEARYRLLFDMTAEPMLILEADSRRIREANAAAAALLGDSQLAGQALVDQLEPGDREPAIAFLGAVAAGVDMAPIRVRLADGAAVWLAGRVYRQAGTGYLLVRLGVAEAAASSAADGFAHAVAAMPDAFVIADRSLAIVAANPAMVEIVQAASEEQLRSRPLGDVLGRPGIDLDLIMAQLGEHGVARNVATIVRGLLGGRDEVEVSAARIGPDRYGFTLRVVARRLRDLPPAERGMPRSVEQLTELIGRMPLKDIVRESTDLIERQCIEAALAYTSNNRASAAEILGLSRQSLYSKLHRHGLVGSEQLDD
ncbi:transcriptional regulator PpsR [Sphingomonas changnyeongensis]|uniref:Transcriptional regulator PpsR n=1 Tax=Sphingomonas changnyeongensis TaxID=2698679 RepID=A0A7Z2NWZ2_9SPHN|nr:transcriptional regulator PpsR [Sphingomonas changnyeongensis]QHL91325.1 transcriptional regulator PpsR [Sphingomonas changnyeongensis]